MKLKKNVGILAVGMILALSGCAGISEAVSSLVGGVQESTKALEELPGQMAALQFLGLYAASAYYSGYSFEEDYKEGQGTVWEVVSETGEGTESFESERALLKKLPDKTSWWRLHYSDGEENILYEYLLDTELNILKVRYRNPETGEVEEWISEPSEESEQETEEEVQEVSEEDYGSYDRGRETVTVKAGTYTADHLVYEDEEDKGRIEWWVTAEVPNGVVKYLATDLEDNSEVTGELVDVRTGYKTELGSY